MKLSRTGHTAPSVALATSTERLNDVGGVTPGAMGRHRWQGMADI